MAWCPRSRSGATQPGLPMICPACVCAIATSRSRAIPKSMTNGPRGDSSTLPGLRSRCTSPASCVATSAAAVPRATPYARSGVSAPCAETTWESAGPGTYSVTR